MRKFLFIISLLVLAISFSCSNSEDESEVAMCCGYTIEELKESYRKMYGDILAKDEITAQQRIEAEAELKKRLEDPCYYHKLTAQGECD